jgi:pimeloyl-ACP methyl ester carboxylesterase
MPKVHTNGIEIYYETHGAGPPLVLIAGVGYGLWFWHKVAPKLAEHLQVIAFDNRGAGQSDKPDGPYTVPMLAADTAGLMDVLGVRGAAVLGHSLGGYVAQELALTRPELVGQLILAATNHGGPNAIPITPEALEVLTNREGNPLELIRRGIAIAAAPGFAERQPEVAQALLEYRLTNPVPPAQYQAQVMAGAAMITTSYEGRLHEIQVPTLILFGEHDKVVPPGNAELLANNIAGAQVKILAGVGHIFPVEDPTASVAALLDFLTESGS